jgi:hypothetical protein
MEGKFVGEVVAVQAMKACEGVEEKLHEFLTSDPYADDRNF